jgi:hypothetical protein
VANANNLIPGAHGLTVDEQSRGGRESAKKRKEKRKLREIVESLLQKKVSDLPTAKKIAEALGASEDISVKELAVLALLANTLLKGDIEDFEALEKILGEDKEEEVDETAASIEIIVEDASQDE